MSKKQYRARIRENEVEFIKTLLGNGYRYEVKSRPRLTEAQFNALMKFRDGGVIDDVKTFPANIEEDYKEFIELLSTKGKFELYDVLPATSAGDRQTAVIAQFSDQHIDEVVAPESVLGLNAYNPEIAKKRFENHFYLVDRFVSHHQEHYNIRHLFLLFQGDTIGGWIHDELAQTNSMSPNEAIYLAKSLYVSGLKFLNDNTDVDKITVVCVCGNHSRETRKIQFANFNDTNKEYWMYLEIENICKMMGLTKIEFIIPKAEMAVITIFGKRYVVAHGHQFKYGGGIGGIFPPMLRWFAGLSKVLKADAAFVGHWHQSIFHRRVVVNGSSKGYDGYALSKMLEFEEPSQNLVLVDSEYGLCNFQRIIL